MARHMCGYCGLEAAEEDHRHRLPMKCCVCERVFHLDCLHGNKPPTLLGDQLFEFYCTKCSTDVGTETWRRMDLNWVHVIHLALYNLIITEDGHDGFFRWNTDICRFIESHWSQLMPNRRKTGSWQSTVAGILSVNSKILFCSGTQKLGESGYWTLQAISPPRIDSFLKTPIHDTQSSTTTPVKDDYCELVKQDHEDGSLHQESTEQRLVHLSERQERMLATHLKQVCTQLGSSQQCLKAKRLYRKLVVRQLKRNHGLQPFSCDSAVKQSIKSKSVYWGEDPVAVPISRDAVASEAVDYCSHALHSKVRKILDTTTPVAMAHTANVSTRTHGPVVTQITSPLTSRVLTPCIYRSPEFFPTKVKLLRELVHKVQQLDSYQTKFVEFSYFQEQHLSAINSLVSFFFWPVDLREYLQYPDFTVVVTYGKLVIGCGFMTPDVKVTETYISFLLVHPDFRRAGIGKVMLYHLAQSCLGKDITLHVSIDNPAMLLYQQFGFKIEQMCLDFYEKYYPPKHHYSKNAFLMRLCR